MRYFLRALTALFILLFCAFSDLSAQNFQLKGYVKNSVTGEPIEGANVYITNLSTGVMTDSTGYFAMFLPQGVHSVEFTYVGFESKKRNIALNRAVTINMNLEESSQLLQEVSVSGQAENHNISSSEIGVSKMSMKTIEKMPSFMGEVDVMKSLLMLPGVSTVGEGTTGLNVRGGNIDQNLILLDDAPVFNSSHLMGLFSVFNPDMVRDVTFYRGAIPAQYGSRVSSVLDIKIRNPETERLKLAGGVGLISNRLMLEGPIGTNEKLSFLIGGRASFSDYLLKISPNKSIQDTRANFYDVTGKLLYKLNNNNKLQVSFYRAHDGFKLASDSLASVEINASSSQFAWETANATVRWDHAFADNFIANIVGVYSDYNAIISSPEPTNGFDLTSAVKYRKLKSDFSWFGSGGHSVMFGVAATKYIIDPGHLDPNSDQSSVNELLLQQENGLELAGFVSDEIVFNDKITLMLGLRYSYFQNMGERNVYSYDPTQPFSLKTITDTTFFSRGEKVASYHGAEPRFSFKYSLNPSSSIKLGYNKMRQYLQLVSNTTAALPIDRWQLSNTYSQPIIADQLSVGYFKNINSNEYEVSTEVFYKTTQNVSDYKDGAELLLNQALETAILHGSGYAYGVEFQTKKNLGRLTGWLSYTYSQARQQVKGEFEEEEISGGEYYPTNFNKPHILNMSATWKESARVNFSANFTYSTGRPVTYPDDKYYVYGLFIPNYVSRNQYKIPDYHRLDLAMTVGPDPAKQTKWKGSWTFSIYNVYARKNAYSVFFKPNNQASVNQANAYKLSIFGTIFPSITYNFSF
ncbi:MAG: TonB-dependent receptor [Imperialibacter sp.]|uniref:TonB-dependent receptor n=1 Tax=Imperialibacter sp. TaxID=2038411 RepID=UPI0032EB503F